MGNAFSMDGGNIEALIRSGYVPKRPDSIIPTEYIQEDPSNSRLRHALAKQEGAGSSFPAIEEAYGVGVKPTTGEQVASGMLGFAKPLLAGLGQLSDPDQGNFGGAAVNQALKDVDYWQNLDQDNAKWNRTARLGLTKDDDLNRAYALTQAQFGSATPPTGPVDNVLTRNVALMQQMAKSPSDIQPYYAKHYNQSTGNFDIDASILDWEQHKERLAKYSRTLYPANAPEAKLIAGTTVGYEPVMNSGWVPSKSQFPVSAKEVVKPILIPEYTNIPPGMAANMAKNPERWGLPGAVTKAGTASKGATQTITVKNKETGVTKQFKGTPDQIEKIQAIKDDPALSDKQKEGLISKFFSLFNGD